MTAILAVSGNEVLQILAYISRTTLKPAVISGDREKLRADVFAATWDQGESMGPKSRREATLVGLTAIMAG